MNKTNLHIDKKTVAAAVLVLVVLAFAYPVYFVNSKIRNYKSDALEDYTKFAQLESEKNVLDLYNKISLKGSKESLEIKKYVLTNNRKDVLGLINELENYTKKIGITEGGNSPIVSVATRENAAITKYNAADLVVTMRVVGTQKSIEDFVNVLNNLPLISYIEKVEVRFDQINNKNSATIVVVLYQKNEIK